MPSDSPTTSGLNWPEEAVLVAFCRTCADLGYNPFLYEAEKADFVTRNVALGIKSGKEGHGTMLKHEVFILNGHCREFIQQ